MCLSWEYVVADVTGVRPRLEFITFFSCRNDYGKIIKEIDIKPQLPNMMLSKPETASKCKDSIHGVGFITNIL